MSWWKAKTPEQVVAEPWLHPAVAAYLGMLLAAAEPRMRVLEHGSGGSTLWLAERALKVLSVEHDPAWAAKMQGLTESLEHVKVKTELRPEGVDSGWDLLLIDGERESRPLWAYHAHRLVRPGGIVVFDNSNRPEYISACEHLKAISRHHILFDVNPPGHRYAVTSMYRLKGGEANGEDWI